MRACPLRRPVVVSSSMGPTDELCPRSPPVTYEVIGNTLLRTTLGETEHLIYGDVQDFELARAGDRVTVRLTLRDADQRSRPWTDVIQREIYVRN